MTPAALAIDLGTTAAKASVVSTDGRILGSGIAGVTTTFGADGSAEQDAEAVWRAVLVACRDAVRAAGPDAAATVTVVVPTSQWASIVPVDADGRPVAPMVLWLDQRGDRHTGALHASPGGREHRAIWSEINGLVPMASLGHLLHLQHDRPEVHARTAAYLEPMDYLGARLTGRLAASANSAMPMALTDNRRLGEVSWATELVERSGVDPSRLPELLPSLSVLGPLLPSVAAKLGLGPQVVVAVGANDSIAAALGTGAVEPGRGTVVLGTTGVFTAHHPTRAVAPERFVTTMPSALQDRYYVMAEAGLGGKVFEAFLDQIVVGNDEFSGPPPGDLYERAFRVAAGVAPGAAGVQFLPWLNGSLAPAPDLGLRGAFAGLSLGTTRAHLLHAVLEGVAMQMRWLVDEVEDVLGVRYDSVRFAGGGAQSDVWAGVMADVLGRPVEQIEDPRHAKAGAGFLGFLSTGLLQLADLEALVPVRRRYEPDAADTELFTERLAIHRSLHAALAEPSHRLLRWAAPTSTERSPS